ncbi:MAG: protein-disulfide reductase [Betaproteobacteria bacterium]|nr:protein-disulfide reductase [Betaproteobacteria bacterium]
MSFILRCLLCACLLTGLIPVSAQTSLRNNQVQAELLAHAPHGVQAGQTFWLGLKIAHAPHWHTYWQNPGDSGLPTQLHWQLPNGLQAGAIAWPLPKKIPIGSLANYGYEGTVLLAVPVQVTPQFQPPLGGRLRIALRAEWLVCRQECIPQEGQFTLELPAHSATALHGDLFDAAHAATPQNRPGAHSAHITEDGQHLRLRMAQLPSAWHGQTLSLLPATPHVMHNAAQLGRDWHQQWDGATWTAQVPVSPERGDSPSQMQWVLALGPETAPRPPAVQVDTSVQGRWPERAPSAGVSPALAQALEAAAQTAPAAPRLADIGFGLALLGALIGGLILNLMPCVFPVLAIKVLGFTRTGITEAQHRASGLAYSLGAVLAFVLLGGLMLALRAAGEQLGWGFQLQSPAMVIALAVLFSLLGLNLAGLFEFGQLLPSALAHLHSRHPTIDAALSGVLAVAVASPCTAPFMGASLGLAVSLPAWQALPVFASMGLGMALPYLALSFWPALAHRLPRPGVWMQTFRQAMAFPMFATVVWLVWVLGQQSGVDTVAALLALLVLIALGLWASLRQGRTRIAWLGLCALLLTGLLSQWPTASLPASTTASAPGERWQAWDADSVRKALAQDRTVFVDFTAAWCVTCQYNKKTVLASAEVLAAFDAKQVLALRADWTRRDPAITAELGRLGRSGVPVYAVYAPGRAPQVLSELPSAADILRALP